MKVPPLSERPVNEEEEQAFPAPPSRRKKHSIAATRAALRPWVIGIGLTVLVAVACVVAYRLAAGIASWNEKPSATATPTVHPAPAPTVSSEPAMSGGYAIGPDGVLVRPAEFAADTYTKPELPEAAKENTERGAELAAEHYVATLSYAWNTGDTQALASLSAENVPFADGYINAINSLYSNGWAYGNTATITSIVEVEPVTAEMGAPPNTIGVLFHVTTTNGTSCQGQRIVVSDNEYTVSFALFMTWQGDRWLVTDGNIPHGNDK